jgi:N-acetylglucosaminyldiphosphoundecaprenol N-acetyl-beta-D-mannosaminyltransferase
VRELAHRQARGEWLAYIDQDDLWLPDKLERQLALAGDPRVGLVYGRAIAFRPDGREGDFDHRHEFTSLPEGDIYERLFVDSCFVTMSATMLRRAAVEALGPIPDVIRTTPDYWLFTGVARSWTARAVPGAVCRYRLHVDSLTHASAPSIHEECLWLVDRHAAHLPPRLAAWRRKVHETILAYHDLRRLRTFPRGLARLVTRGSVSYFLTRPAARTFRAVRREIQTPTWKRAAASRPEGDGGYVSCANVYSVTHAHEDEGYRRLLNGAALVTTDGMPIVWALRCLGVPAERVHNDDLFLSCCERFPAWRHFLVGGRAGQPEEVAEALRRRFPGISVVGARATPVRPVPADETEGILAEIRAARPDVVWVGMGTPAQDEWMNAAAARVRVPMVGCGSSFDLVTGRTRPAPEWVKRSGLQWLFRWVQEPRRLARRYLVYNPRFVLSFAVQLARHAVSHREAARG